MESFLDAPMYKRAISNDQSDVVTHFDDFVASDKSIFRKKIRFQKILKIAHSTGIFIIFFYFFMVLFYKNSTPRLIK